MTVTFDAVATCWVCGGGAFTAIHDAAFELSIYRGQDPELADYTGSTVTLQRCQSCGFAQPAALPALPRFFDRLYDTRWSDEWIVTEHHATYKDLIITDVLAALARRSGRGRTLLDVGAHAGRFLRQARAAGWDAEGLELNPKTAAYAAQLSGAPVHQGNIHAFVPRRCYDAVTLTDVLEHVPHPLDVLRRVHALLCPGGWVAVKVPNGPSQHRKETMRARLRPAYRATLADNLVHVNHFSAASLARALGASGFRDVTVAAGAPELFGDSRRQRVDRMLRMTAFRLARALPGGAASPLAFNLQAYGRRD